MTFCDSQTIDFSCRRRLTFKEVFRHSSFHATYLCMCVLVCVCVVCSCASLASLQLHRAAMASLCFPCLNNAFRQVFCLLKSIRNFLCDLSTCLSVGEVHNSKYNSICFFFRDQLTEIGFHLLLIFTYVLKIIFVKFCYHKIKKMFIIIIAFVFLERLCFYLRTQ